MTLMLWWLPALLSYLTVSTIVFLWLADRN
jgi:hypothetical protein